MFSALSACEQQHASAGLAARHKLAMVQRKLELEGHARSELYHIALGWMASDAQNPEHAYLCRQRERERERRLDERDRHGVKKSKLTRDSDRDISEKIALGQANVGGGTGVVPAVCCLQQEAWCQCCGWSPQHVPCS